MVSFDWFEIRKSDLPDIPHVYKIDSQSMVSDYSPDAFIEKLIYFGDMFLVATETDTGRVIGYVVGSHDSTYTQEYPGYVYISRFAVKNKFRRRGVGATMLMVLENAMLMTGKFRGMVGDVRLSNKPSLAFFKNSGYVPSNDLSRPNGYSHGNTPEERYKVVLYKNFPVINP